MTSGPDLAMTDRQIRALLEEPIPGVLTTLDSEGWPHSAGMWFVSRDDGVAMWTYAKSQKSVNVARDPRVAFLVEKGEPYKDLRGVLIRGTAELIVDERDVRAIGLEVYRKYLEVRVGLPAADGPIQEIERQSKKRVGIVIRAARVASWDHGKAGGR